MSIQEVSDKTGLPKSTLRYWEKEFDGIISPERTPGGQRRYRQNHIELFRKISLYKQEGKSIQEIKQLFINQACGGDTSHAAGFTPVEMLVSRIAELVSEEVNRFLTEHHLNSSSTSGVAE